MEQTEVKALLEKYWQAETSLEEEQLLADYFRQPEIDPELEQWRELFAWREEEAQVRPGADFDRRLLDRIAETGPAATIRPLFSFRSAAAAAIILCIGLSALLMVTAPRGIPGASVTSVVALRPDKSVRGAVAIRDTYADPRQALDVVRRALLLASARINQGQRITQKNITRFHQTWQAATGD